MRKNIYHVLSPGDNRWITTKKLESLLKIKLVGLNLNSYPIRTRSKVVKIAVCEAMGYEPPSSFKKTRPRFPCQNLDIYIQKSKNLQIWNEELDDTRRYALIHLNSKSVVQNIKILTGEELAPFDKTGTLTQKYQAVYKNKNSGSLLLSSDTYRLKKWLCSIENKCDFRKIHPTNPPEKGSLLPIEFIFDKLKTVINSSIPIIGKDQERNRGAEIHKRVCKSLGYENYRDSGQFPDLLHQMIEIKLQTSPTIDLGLVLPSSNLEIKDIDEFKHCDIRYVIFYGRTTKKNIILDRVLICSGEKFFDHFIQMQGKVVNTKIQISLPKNFFK